MKFSRGAAEARRSSPARRRSRRSPSPATITSKTGVQTPVLDRFRYVLRGDGALLRQVGDGAGDAQHAVIGASGEQQPRERVAQELLALAIGRAMPIDVARAEQGVGLSLAVQLC